MFHFKDIVNECFLFSMYLHLISLEDRNLSTNIKPIFYLFEMYNFRTIRIMSKILSLFESCEKDFLLHQNMIEKKRKHKRYVQCVLLLFFTDHIGFVNYKYMLINME